MCVCDCSDTITWSENYHKPNILTIASPQIINYQYQQRYRALSLSPSLTHKKFLENSYQKNKSKGVGAFLEYKCTRAPPLSHTKSFWKNIPKNKSKGVGAFLEYKCNKAPLE